MVGLKPSSKKRNDEIRSVNDRLSDNLKSALQNLERIDKEKLERELAALMAIYGEWSEVFEDVSKQMTDAWDVMGELEQHLSEWKRIEPALGPEGKWGPVSLSKRGYHFATGLVKGDDPRAKKWMIVHFAHLDSSQDGMGDERAFGFSAIPTESLSGFDACREGIKNATFEQVQALLAKVKGYHYIFDLHHTTLGQRRIYVHPERFAGRSIAEFCVALLIALNQDDIDRVRALASNGEVRLIEEKPKRRIR